MDAPAGHSYVETVAIIWAAKITTFAVVILFIVYRASFRFHISGFLVINHMNADDTTP
jgi:hypothetical protein